MKYLKEYNEYIDDFSEFDPFEEEDWNEKDKPERTPRPVPPFIDYTIGTYFLMGATPVIYTKVRRPGIFRSSRTRMDFEYIFAPVRFVLVDDNAENLYANGKLYEVQLLNGEPIRQIRYKVIRKFSTQRHIDEVKYFHSRMDNLNLRLNSTFFFKSTDWANDSMKDAYEFTFHKPFSFSDSDKEKNIIDKVIHKGWDEVSESMDYDFDIEEYVKKKHGSQLYGGDKPYIYHILKVKNVCDRFIDIYPWSDEDRRVIETSVMCHDLLEDTDTTKDELVELFGEDVYKIVFNVSGFGETRKQRNEDAYRKIPTDDRSIFVKLCDRISNTEESIGYERKLKMYRDEQPTFKERIFNGKFLEMWDYLDNLFNI